MRRTGRRRVSTLVSDGVPGAALARRAAHLSGSETNTTVLFANGRCVTMSCSSMPAASATAATTAESSTPATEATNRCAVGALGSAGLRNAAVRCGGGAAAIPSRAALARGAPRASAVGQRPLAAPPPQATLQRPRACSVAQRGSDSTSFTAAAATAAAAAAAPFFLSQFSPHLLQQIKISANARQRTRPVRPSPLCAGVCVCARAHRARASPS